MSKTNLDRIVSPEIRSHIQSLGLNLELKPSVGVVTPRESRATVWVGTDVRIPIDLINNKTNSIDSNVRTTMELASIYFNAIGENEADYIWLPVTRILKGDELKYFTSKREASIYADSRGFIYMTKSYAAEVFSESLLNGNVEQDDVYKTEILTAEAKHFFNKELDLYAAWESNEIYSIKIATPNDSVVDVTPLVWNVANAIEEAIQESLQSVKEQISRLDNTVTLTLKVDEMISRLPNRHEVVCFADEVADKFKAFLTIGDYKVNEDTLELTFTVDSLPSFTRMKNHSDHGLHGINLFKNMEQNINYLATNKGFDKMDGWAVIDVLMSDVDHESWPPMVLNALIRSMVDGLEDFELLDIEIQAI